MKRIDHKYIIDEIRSILNFEKGIPFTIKELLIRPGQSVRKYLKEDRSFLVKPVSFVIICSIIYFVIQQWFHFDEEYLTNDDFQATVILGWLIENYGYANLILGILIGFWVKVVFRSREYNLYEIFVLIFYILGMTAILNLSIGLIQKLLSFRLLSLLELIPHLYFIWGVGQFFGSAKKSNYFKSLLSYFLGLISLLLIVLILGLIVDKI